MFEDPKNREKILALREAPGEIVRKVSLGDLPRGTIVRAKTKQGNCYLFEVVRPKHAYIFRCKPRIGGGGAGLLDDKPEVVSGTFRVRWRIRYWCELKGSNKTSPVTEIAILPREAVGTL